MNDFTITDNYGYENYDFLDNVLKVALKKLKIKNAVFSIVFVDEEKIQQINKEYRKIDRITDVISFAFEDNAKMVYNDLRVLGDIYICIPRMQSQAIEYGHSEKRELSFLAVHGLLHLLGYDHMNIDEEKVMFDLQEMILNEANIPRGN